MNASAIVMDTRTSQVLAMASWPPIDPSDLSDATSEQTVNMPTGYTYEPGSTFKAFTVAGALQDGTVKPNTQFDVGPSIQVADRTIEEAHEGLGYRTLTTADILAQSSNVGAVKIGLEVGAKRFSEWVDKFGFGHPTGIQYSPDEQGIVPPYSDYSGSSIGNLPIGQGLSVTPMQMMEGYAAIANGGILRPPRLLESVDGEPVDEPQGHRVISKSTSAELRKMLEGVLGAVRHRARGRGARLRPRGQDRHRAEVVDGTYPTASSSPSCRLRARRRPEAARLGDCRRSQGGDYYGGTVAAPPSARSPASRFPTWESRRRADRAGEPPPANLESRAMRLDQLLADLGLPARVRGDDSAEITDLAFDSSRVEPGTLFFCVQGMSADGHNFAPAALEGGAAALVVDHHLDLDVPQVLVEDTRRAMAPLAARFFGDPSRELRMIGITGTNGKTTTAFLARAILEAAGLPCGLLGTVKQVVGGVEEEVVRTTPEAIDLQRTFRRMLDGGDRACVMEVSSHALVLGRADAIAFDVAAFTNLTQDHLDFHSDMEDYYEAKRLLFLPLADGGLLPPGAATVNVDDGYGARLRDELLAAGSPPVSSFSAAGAEADLSAHSVTFDAGGTSFELRLAGVTEALPVRLGIPGHFNVENALAALGCARALDVAPDVAIAALAGAESVLMDGSWSTRARISACSSTTPTPRIRWRTCCGRRGASPMGDSSACMGAAGTATRASAR